MQHSRQDRDETIGHPLLKAAGLADRLGFQLRMAQAAVWSDLVAALQPFGLRPSHYSALLIVRATPGCRQQDIGEALGIQRPNVVAMIDGMERRGILKREVNPSDRRSYALSLTQEGQVLLEQADAAHRAHEARFASQLDDGAAAALIPVLKQIAAAIGAPAA
ncbi:MAG: transcriptional regulator, MarR family [Sphingomonas bacterium]|nr:transcriptional regulator, MarR family [Sphingomonas bacterium]MDB5682471.1 transcriptional regulator, MarR family [Sphingomonas bacterium]